MDACYVGSCTTRWGPYLQGVEVIPTNGSKYLLLQGPLPAKSKYHPMVLQASPQMSGFLEAEI